MKYKLFEEFVKHDKENDNFLDYSYISQLFSKYHLNDKFENLFGEDGLFLSEEDFDEAVSSVLQTFSKNAIIAYFAIKLENEIDFKDSNITSLKLCSSKELAKSDGVKESCNYIAKLTLSKMNINFELTLQSYVANYFKKNNNYYIYIKSSTFLSTSLESF